jgi:hypothetical protein
MPKSSKAKPLLLSDIQKLTYHLSFQYGTANKATRFPSVLQYSIRLNKIAIGYVHSLCDRIDEDRKLVLGEDSVYRRQNGDGRILRHSHDNGDDWKSGLTTIPFHPQYMG